MQFQATALFGQVHFFPKEEDWVLERAPRLKECAGNGETSSMGGVNLATYWQVTPRAAPKVLQNPNAKTDRSGGEKNDKPRHCRFSKH
jgi:hypothetical protein